MTLMGAIAAGHRKPIGERRGLGAQLVKVDLCHAALLFNEAAHFFPKRLAIRHR